MDLTEARFKRRKTQYDVCKATGIPQSMISLIERGYVMPSEEKKRKIAEALNFSVKEIHWEEQNEDRKHTSSIHKP